MPEINLVDFFKYYENQPQQAEGVQLLQQSMPDSLLKNESAWVKKYREEPDPPQGEAGLANPLPVEYFWQAGQRAGWLAAMPDQLHRHVS